MFSRVLAFQSPLQPLGSVLADDTYTKGWVSDPIKLYCTKTSSRPNVVADLRSRQLDMLLARYLQIPAGCVQYVVSLNTFLVRR